MSIGDDEYQQFLLTFGTSISGEPSVLIRGKIVKSLLGDELRDLYFVLTPGRYPDKAERVLFLSPKSQLYLAIVALLRIEKTGKVEGFKSPPH
jgi:hypothetical protein